MRGTNFAASRCDISDVIDGFHVTGGAFSAEGCYLHDFALYDGSSGASDHADDARFRYVGNPTTGIQLFRVGITGQIQVTGNIFDAVPSVPTDLQGQPLAEPVPHTGGLLVWEH